MAPVNVNGARPIKLRRGRQEVAAVREAMLAVLEEDHPMTVRQVFYRLVSLGAIGKTETEYKATVVRLLTEMRLEGEVPFDWLADNTRWMRKPPTFSSLESALRRTAEAYRRSVWDSQDVYVEIWLEKDALSGVMYEETADWDVPLMVTRGYPSVTFLHAAARAICAQGKPAYLYYFGDHDPSGVDIPRNVEERLRQFTEGAEIHFQRVAVTPEQIALWGLPTRPTKISDTRSKGFLGESVEVDAIPPRQLRELVRDCIEGHIEPIALDRLLIVEREEREALQALAARWMDRTG